MHPILASRRHLALYLSAWLPVVALLTVAMVLTGWGDWVQSLVFVFPMVVVYAFLCLAAWYPCRAMPLNRDKAETALFTHLASAALSALFWVAMAWVLVEGFKRSTFYAGTTGLTGEQTGIFFISGVLLYLLSVTIHYLFVAAEASREAERRALEAEVAARDAELQALKAQLNPHFLFNSLNSVASLAATDPDGARDMCIQLGDYLRGTLKGGSEPQPFREELEQVRRFLRVESVRYGDRLQVIEEIEDRCLGVPVPPLILQPLVENALKHGIAGLVEGGEVRIGARCGAELLTVRVENPVDPESRPSSGGAGVGLANVRHRLKNVFGDDARLRSSGSRTTYRVEVVIPVISDRSRPVREEESDG